MLICSDGAKRRSGATSSAWVIYDYRHIGGGRHTPHILVRDGFCIQDDQTTAFGAELLALEGAVKAAIELVLKPSLDMHNLAIQLFCLFSVSVDSVREARRQRPLYKYVP